MLSRTTRIAFSVFAVLALLWPAAGSAGSIFIDFDSLPGGGTPALNTPVGDAYASLGVVFSTLDDGGVAPPKFRRTSGIGQPPSIGVGDFSRPQTSELGFHIFASFSTPLSAIAVDTFGPSATEFLTIAIAFDADGNELGRIASDEIFGTFKGRLELSGIGAIASVLWTTNQPFRSSIRIDDLKFSVVPEPTAAVLFALGFAVLRGTARRR